MPGAAAVVKGEEGTHLFYPPHENVLPVQVTGDPLAPHEDLQATVRKSRTSAKHLAADVAAGKARARNPHPFPLGPIVRVYDPAVGTLDLRQISRSAPTARQRPNFAGSSSPASPCRRRSQLLRNAAMPAYRFPILIFPVPGSGHTATLVEDNGDIAAVGDTPSGSACHRLRDYLEDRTIRSHLGILSRFRLPRALSAASKSAQYTVENGPPCGETIPLRVAVVTGRTRAGLLVAVHPDTRHPLQLLRP